MLSWFQKTPKSNLPEPTPLQTLRAKQIEQLRSFDSSISEIHRDVEYRVTISDVLQLYICLPPNFPQERPVFTIRPPARHPWVNDQMVVTGCISLNNFVTHSDLGKVAREIVEEFRKNPPTLLSTPSNISSLWPPTVTQPSTTYSTATPNLSDSRQPYAGTSASSTNIAPENPHLKDLSMSELKELLEDEDKLLQLVASQSDDFQASHQQQLLSLERAARENIEKKNLLEEKKRTVLEKYYLMNDLRHKFDELLRRQDEVHTRYDLNLMQDNLKVAALQAEEKAEAIADDFLEGKLSAEEFHKNYMATRTLCHIRRAKEEKLSQCIRQRLRPY